MKTTAASVPNTLTAPREAVKTEPRFTVGRQAADGVFPVYCDEAIYVADFLNIGDAQAYCNWRNNPTPAPEPPKWEVEHSPSVAGDWLISKLGQHRLRAHSESLAKQVRDLLNAGAVR